MKWHKIIGNSNLIQFETERAYLIRLPKSELMFWHPKKLVRLSGKKSYKMTISYSDEFKFKVFRNGKGRFNFKEILEEKILSIDQWKEYFKGFDQEQ